MKRTYVVYLENTRNGMVTLDGASVYDELSEARTERDRAIEDEGPDSAWIAHVGTLAALEGE